jgi:hypothetical protein
MLSIILIQNQNTSLKNGGKTIAIHAIQPFSFYTIFKSDFNYYKTSIV